MRNADEKHRRFSDMCDCMTGKHMTKKKKIRKTILLLGAACLFLLRASAVRAASRETETEKPEKEIIKELKAHGGGIVRVESVCWDGEEKVYQTKSFSGLVVSGEASGIHVVTIHKNLMFTPEEKAKIKTEYELEDNAKISDKIDIVFEGDLRVRAEIAGESDQRNLTVLRMNQNVSFGDILPFSQKSVSDKEKLYLLSYPEVKDGEKAVYNAENAAVAPGTAGDPYKKDDIVFFKHDIKADGCSAGGPLLDNEGHVIGIFLSAAGKKNGTAISSEAIREFLDTLNVDYQEYREVVEEKKIPLVNLILGALIAGLLLLALVRQIRGMATRDKGEEADPDGRKRGGSGRKGKASAKPKRDDSARPGASLEYPEEKRFAHIRKKEFLIGRQTEADFSLANSRSVSRRHACIRTEGGKYYLSDLNSTNFTFLNGQKIEPGRRVQLSDRDEIMVGKEKLIFHMG